MAEHDLALIKGGKGGLSLVIDEAADIASVIDELRDRLQTSPSFFRGAALQLQTDNRALSESERELLTATVEEFGMVLSDTDEQSASEPPADDAQQETDSTGPQSVADRLSDEGERRQMKEHEEGRALLVKRTLRSGQSITFDGNVVIRGDVNPGALITSTGDIIVLGTLRGVAHAGASGDIEAVVMAFQLEPTQLRIAGAISRAPDEKMKMPRPSGPEVARVKDDMILIEAYEP